MPKKEKLAVGLLLIAVASRIIPHIPNFTALESIALFSGVYIASKRISFLLPIVAIYFTDLLLNNTILRTFYPADAGFIWISGYMLWTFVAILGIVVLGSFLKNRLKPVNVLLFSFTGSILFFIVSNFGVWLGSPVYGKSLTGLVECYTLALPFFRNSLISNLLFTVLLFGIYELASRKLLSSEPA